MGMVYLQLECCSGKGNMKFVKNVIILNMTRNTQIKTIIFLGKDHPEFIFLGKELNMKSEKRWVSLPAHKSFVVDKETDQVIVLVVRVVLVPL